MGIETQCSQGLRITWLVGVRAGYESLPTVSAPLDSSQWDSGSWPLIYNTSGRIREDPGHPHCELFSRPSFRFICLFIHFIPVFIHLLLGAQISFWPNPIFFNHKSYVSFCCFFIGGYLIYNLELVSDVQQSDLVIHIAILFQILFLYRLLYSEFSAVQFVLVD